MRTTVTIDDDLLQRAKATAARSGRTLNAVVEDALRQALDARTAGPRSERPTLPTFSSRHIQSGVDLDDSAGLLELMEQSNS